MANKHFGTVSAALYEKDCCVADLPAVGNANELTRAERWAFPAPVSSHLVQGRGV